MRMGRYIGYEAEDQVTEMAGLLPACGVSGAVGTADGLYQLTGGGWPEIGRITGRKREISPVTFLKMAGGSRGEWSAVG